MPRKIRELRRDLRKAGFIYRPGKGSHTIWDHPRLPYAVSVSGKDGDDARPYQEQDLKSALDDLEGTS